MRYSDSDPYIIDRRGRKSRGKSRGREGRGTRRAVAWLIALLLILTAAICLIVVFLPRLGGSTGASATVNGKTFFFLCTAETDDKTQAQLASQHTLERGGAGYIYNDGMYRIVAAVYERESDAKTLTSVNADSYYFSLTFPTAERPDGDRAVLEYLSGEWFSTVYTAASELERGNIKEAAAENAVARAADKLASLALKADRAALSAAVSRYDNGAAGQSRSVLSAIRYYNVDTVLSVYSALSL